MLNGRNQFEVRKVTPFKDLGAGRTLLAQKVHECIFVLPKRHKNQLFCSRGTVGRVFFQTSVAIVIVFLAEMGRIPWCSRPESSSSNI